VLPGTNPDCLLGKEWRKISQLLHSIAKTMRSTLQPDGMLIAMQLPE
jgi:hypothetical protein